MKAILDFHNSDKKDKFIGLFYIPDRLERKALHLHLETHHPAIHKASFSCESFERERKYLWKCRKCGNMILLNESDMDTQYASYFGTCRRCQESIDWEPFYDDYPKGLFRVDGNVFVFGDALKNYSNRVTPQVVRGAEYIPFPDEIDQMLKNKQLMLISVDGKISDLRAMRRNDLAKWIDDKLKEKAYVVT